MLKQRPMRSRRWASRGLSVVELMVGIAISLFVLAGATLMATSQMAENRLLLLDMQVQQDLRAATDLLVRGIRRAGYNGRAAFHVWPDSSVSPALNPYGEVIASPALSSTSIAYFASQDERTPVAGNLLPAVGTDNETIDSNEFQGFRWNMAQKTIEVLVGQGNWQTLTDPNVVKISNFEVRLVEQPLAVPCGAACPAVAAGCSWQLQLRSVVIDIEAEGAHDPNVRRSLSTEVRLRNDLLVEVC